MRPKRYRSLWTLSPMVFDTDGLDSWKRDAVLRHLKLWQCVLKYAGMYHKAHGDLVKAVDFMAEGVEQKTVSATKGRAFIADRLADIREVLAIYPVWSV